MRDLEDFSDGRHKHWCIHCSRALGTDRTKDHVPSKCLLLRPFPTNLPVIPVCKECNASFRKDEAYTAAAIGVALSGTTDPNKQTFGGVGRMLRADHVLRDALDACRRHSANNVQWFFEMEKIHNTFIKNARGHALYELGEPMLSAPSSVWVGPIAQLRSRVSFEDVSWSGWPEVGSRLMSRIAAGTDLVNGWIEVQSDVYRYAVLQDDGIIVRSVIAEYIASEVRWDDQ